MINGALYDYLCKDLGKTLTLSHLADIAYQIANGMAHLEKNRFAHGDLRAANILVGFHKEVKVADFGLARLVLEKDSKGLDNKKVVRWMAPEAVVKRTFSAKSDVWSYGVVLYELITFGQEPYPDIDKDREVLEQVQKGFRMPKPTGGPVQCPDPYYEIMLKCWNRDPDSRPTFEYMQDFFHNYRVWSEGDTRKN